MKARCIVFPRPLKAEIGEIEVPPPGPGQLFCRTLMTGVSTGTETRVFRGKQDKSVFPLIPGYENLGVVVEAGPGTTTPVGQRLMVRGHLYDPSPYTTCWGAQVSHSLTTEENLVVVPEGVSDDRAVYAKVAGISLHGVKRARVRRGEWVVVVGLGLIGHLVVQHAVARDAKVIAVDTLEDRLELAGKAGATHTLNAKDRGAVDRANEITGGGADVAFDATGLASVLDPTSRYLRARPRDDSPDNCARLVLQGTVEEPITLGYRSLYTPEVDLVTPRDCDTQDLIDSLELMARGRIHPEMIPASRYSYRDCALAYPRLVSREIMRVLYTWGSPLG
jgi:2-desacetyl-2-hydroxyethyl bacteriochlorophyllide A dehydrogenase